MADLYCDSVQGEFTGLSCGVEKGRVVALGLVLPTVEFTADPSDDAEWVTNTESSPQTAWVITEGVRGEMPRATDTEDEGFGMDATQLTGAEWSVNLQILGLNGNVDFTNIVNKKKWHVALPYSNGEMFYIDSPCTVIFRPVVQTDLKSTNVWDVQIKWSSIDNPQIYTTPASLLAA